jgi:hypothetical protein
MTMINGEFIWWHVVDGVAYAVPDSTDVSRAIDNGQLTNIYGTIEGAIKHGGVLATAFKRRTEATYDALAWLQTGAMVPAGQITTTTITATREA